MGLIWPHSQHISFVCCSPPLLWRSQSGSPTRVGEAKEGDSGWPYKFGRAADRVRVQMRLLGRITKRRSVNTAQIGLCVLRRVSSTGTFFFFFSRATFALAAKAGPRPLYTSCDHDHEGPNATYAPAQHTSTEHVRVDLRPHCSVPWLRCVGDGRMISVRSSSKQEYS